MKRALINAIKIDNLKKLSKEDRCDIIKYLKEKHGYTNRSLGKKLNIPHSTIHDWVNPQRNERGVMKISISVIINRLQEFEALGAVGGSPYKISNKFKLDPFTLHRLD